MTPDENDGDARWQGVLAESCVGIDPGLALEVELSSGEEQIGLRFRNGGLELADFGDGGEPDLAIRFCDIKLKEVLLGKAATGDVFRDAEIAVDGRWRPAAPAAEWELPRGGGFDHIPGASLSVLTLVSSTIFGDVALSERWQDGALVSSEFVAMSELERSSADVRMICTLAQLAAIRRRELTPLDALADGVGMLGEWPQLMCFVELLQHPAYLPVWEADSTVEAQATWGAIFSSPAYGDAALKAQLDSVVAP